MEKTYSSVWQAALGQLEVTMSSANFRTWIKLISLAEISDTEAVLYVPNFMTKNFVEKKFYDDILHSLQQTKPEIVSLSFVIQKSKANEKTSDIEDVFDIQPKESLENPQKSPGSNNNQSSAPTPIQSRYTFDNFIVGSSNRLAFSAAQLVVEKPGEAYNPLFLYGPSGVGKTHLMWAISNEIAAQKPNSVIMYITSEEFTNEFVNAIRKGEKFTNKYREVDVLLVDDIQFIAGKEKTIEEFFHIFNTLHQKERQIVLCSDRPPKEISSLEERLRSRFEWGLVADIQLPDLETRIAILMDKAAQQNTSLTEDVAEYIAHNVDSNIRELEGTLKRLLVSSQSHNTPLTLDGVKQILGDIKPKQQSITVNKILEKTAEFYEVGLTDITGVKRDKEIVLPRQVAMYLIREDLHMSFPKIASNLGGRDHTTVMHGVKKIEKSLLSDTELQKEIHTLREFILQ